MQPLYPLSFDLKNLTRDYMWGGNNLRPLVPDHPADQPLAELWIVSDRPQEDIGGVVSNGPLAGTTLRQLMEERPGDMVGRVPTVKGQFPVLIKLLDAKDRLSLQVHPSTEQAVALGGESKTECAFLLEGTTRTASIFRGLKPDVDRAAFEAALQRNQLESLLRRISVKPGDCLFLPSGCVHAYAEGCFLYEVQQCSDTTYRVYDWGRVDRRTGQPRELHVDQALASIDFADVEPQLQQPTVERRPGLTIERLADCPFFTLERWTTDRPQTYHPAPAGSFDVITVIDGTATVSGGGQMVHLERLGTTLVPASLAESELQPTDGPVRYLRTHVRTT